MPYVATIINILRDRIYENAYLVPFGSIPYCAYFSLVPSFAKQPSNHPPAEP